MEDENRVIAYFILLCWNKKYSVKFNIDGLVPERRNSIVNALELRLSCTDKIPWDLVQEIGYVSLSSYPFSGCTACPRYLLVACKPPMHTRVAEVAVSICWYVTS